jgi:hypothetical protein
MLGVELGVMDGVCDGVLLGVAETVAEGVADGVGVDDAVADGVDDTVFDGVADGVDETVAETVGVADGVLLTVADGVLDTVAEGVALTVWLTVADGVLDGVALGECGDPRIAFSSVTRSSLSSSSHSAKIRRLVKLSLGVPWLPSRIPSSSAAAVSSASQYLIICRRLSDIAVGAVESNRSSNSSARVYPNAVTRASRNF